jgi:signal transduction histidine kinase
VQFYGDDASLVEHLSRDIGAALVADDAVIVIATKAHRAALTRRLGARGLDVAYTTSDGRYISLDASKLLERFLVDGQLDWARFLNVIGGLISGVKTAASGKRRRVLIFGEMVAQLWARAQPEAALRLERYWNDLSATHEFALHCAYPMRLFDRAADGPSFEAICASHLTVLPGGKLSTLATEDDRLRAIAVLQQKARALETELAEHQRTREALIERNKELRAAVAARDQFLSNAAHELRTPVTSLRGVAQLLLRMARRQGAVAPDRLESALNTIDSQTDRLRLLVARLLDTSQIEAGKLRIEPVPTNLVALVDSALAQHRMYDSHVLAYEGPDRLDALVDQVRFEQIISNLLDNAVKFSPQGTRVTVGLRYDTSGEIMLSVTDEGDGIPLDQHARVFERFHQVNGERHHAGMGLGLHIAREIARLHGGDVHIEQPQGPRGARFVVTVPANLVITPAVLPSFAPIVGDVSRTPSSTTPAKATV